MVSYFSYQVLTYLVGYTGSYQVSYQLLQKPVTTWLVTLVFYGSYQVSNGVTYLVAVYGRIHGVAWTHWVHWHATPFISQERVPSHQEPPGGWALAVVGPLGRRWSGHGRHGRHGKGVGSSGSQGCLVMTYPRGWSIWMLGEPCQVWWFIFVVCQGLSEVNCYDALLIAG